MIGQIFPHSYWLHIEFIHVKDLIKHGNLSHATRQKLFLWNLIYDLMQRSL